MRARFPQNRFQAEDNYRILTRRESAAELQRLENMLQQLQLRPLLPVGARLKAEGSMGSSWPQDDLSSWFHASRAKAQAMPQCKHRIAERCRSWEVELDMPAALRSHTDGLSSV